MSDLATEILKPLKKAWIEKIDLARKHKQPFQDTADQCMAFFAGSMGWMYEDKFRKKFLGAEIDPTFKICLCKAFEFVALYGPTLYHRNGNRECRPHDRPTITAERMAAGAGIDWQQAQESLQQYSAMQQAGQQVPLEMQVEVFRLQQMQQQFQQMESQDRLERNQTKAMADVIENYLSYTPKEQPGGLKGHSEQALTEAMVKGRGLLFPAPYRMPGSDRKLTGCFYRSVEHFFMDPDAESAEFGDAKWMALERIEPTWQVERRYGHKPGTLKGNLESSDAQGARRANALGNLERERGNTFDLLKYYQVWSLGGVGTRLTGTARVTQRAFDDVVGDYAHIVVADGVDTPLNATASRFRRADDNWVRDAFSWPVPYWMDRRWPCAILDFYRKPGSAWPIAPISPGLGELTALNVIISVIVQRSWDSARPMLATLKSAGDKIIAQLKSNKLYRVIELDDIHQDINKVISEFNVSDVPFDAWKIVERLFALFDKRVGLSDLLYGMSEGGVASRTATDVKIKDERVSIRPDYMADKVEEWQAEAARMEMLCAYWNGVSGKDVQPVLGTAGAVLWDQLVANADPETIVREVSVTIEQSSIRKPNKQRDATNLNQTYAAMSQQFDKHADVTTDTEPLNNLNQKVGDAIGQDMEGLKMGPRVPPPPPPDEAAAMEAQLEQAKIQAELQLKQMDLQAKQLEMAGKQGEIQAAQATREVDLAQDQQEHGQEMVQDEQVHDQEMRQRAESHALDIRFQEAKARLDRSQAAAKARAQQTKQVA